MRSRCCASSPGIDACCARGSRAADRLPQALRAAGPVPPARGLEARPRPRGGTPRVASARLPARAWRGGARAARPRRAGGRRARDRDPLPRGSNAEADARGAAERGAARCCTRSGIWSRACTPPAGRTAICTTATCSSADGRRLAARPAGGAPAARAASRAGATWASSTTRSPDRSRWPTACACAPGAAVWRARSPPPRAGACARSGRASEARARAYARSRTRRARRPGRRYARLRAGEREGLRWQRIDEASPAASALAAHQQRPREGGPRAAPARPARERDPRRGGRRPRGAEGVAAARSLAARRGPSAGLAGGPRLSRRRGPARAADRRRRALRIPRAATPGAAGRVVAVARGSLAGRAGGRRRRRARRAAGRGRARLAARRACTAPGSATAISRRATSTSRRG